MPLRRPNRRISAVNSGKQRRASYARVTAAARPMAGLAAENDSKSECEMRESRSVRKLDPIDSEGRSSTQALGVAWRR